MLPPRLSSCQDLRVAPNLPFVPSCQTKLLLPKTQVVPSEKIQNLHNESLGLSPIIGYPDQRCLAPRVPLAEVRPDIQHNDELE